jgi:hypothetical protein
MLSPGHLRCHPEHAYNFTLRERLKGVARKLLGVMSALRRLNALIRQQPSELPQSIRVASKSADPDAHRWDVWVPWERLHQKAGALQGRQGLQATQHVSAPLRFMRRAVATMRSNQLY